VAGEGEAARESQASMQASKLLRPVLLLSVVLRGRRRNLSWSLTRRVLPRVPLPRSLNIVELYVLVLVLVLVLVTRVGSMMLRCEFGIQWNAYACRLETGTVGQ